MSKELRSTKNKDFLLKKSRDIYRNADYCKGWFQHMYSRSFFLDRTKYTVQSITLDLASDVESIPDKKTAHPDRENNTNQSPC